MRTSPSTENLNVKSADVYGLRGTSGSGKQRSCTHHIRFHKRLAWCNCRSQCRSVNYLVVLATSEWLIAQQTNIFGVVLTLYSCTLTREPLTCD